MCYCLFCLCKYTYLARSIHARRTKPIFDTTTTNNNWEEITRVPMRFIGTVSSTSLSFYFKQFFMFILCIITSDFLCGNFPSDIFLWHYLFWNLRLECLFNVWYLVATVITCWRNKTEIINHSAMNQSDHQQTTLYLWFFISLFFRKFNPECCVVCFWTNWHHLPLYLLQGFNVFTI